MIIHADSHEGRRRAARGLAQNDDGILKIVSETQAGLTQIPGRVVFGLYMKGDTLIRLGKLLVGGLSTEEAAKRAGCCKDRARKLKQILERQRGAVLRCPCGKPSSHPGQWCLWRRYYFTLRPLAWTPKPAIARSASLLRVQQPAP